jgi:hypothetical protein
MATIGSILNLVECGAAGVLGTGKKGCIQQLRKTNSLWITPDGFEFDSAETLGSTYIQELKAAGNLIILNDVKTFTDNSSDNQIETLEDGTKTVNTLGLYEFAAKFIKGLAFNAALNSLNSYGSYNILFVDAEGNILGTKSANGKLKGFTVGMLQADRLMFGTDNAAQKEGIAFQLTKRYEMDSDYLFISETELGTYRPQAEDGVYEVVLAYTAVPTDGDTTISVTAKLYQNQKPFTGGLTGNFRITKNGATLAQTVAETNGTYVFTVAALAEDDVLTVNMYNATYTTNAALVDLDVYKSNTITTTVLA